jgi:hypothetical protein
MDMSTLLQDSHGAHYATTARHPLFGPALAASIDEIDRPAARRRMVEAVDRYGLPALAAVVREIEQRSEFGAATAGRTKADPLVRRFKQAVGVVVKLAMAEEGWLPALTTDGRQDQGRLEQLRVKPDWFETARRYRLAQHP